MRVVIPAAGLGKRFAVMNLAVPKELLPLGGLPLIGHALAEAHRAGFESAVVVVSPTKHQLHRYLQECRPPLPVEVVVQPEPLGVGEAVLRCWVGAPLAVLLPDDVVLETEHWNALASLHNASGAAALCVRPVPLETVDRFGIAECAGSRVTSLVEKPRKGSTASNLAVFGRYIVTSAVVDGMRRWSGAGELQLTDGYALALGPEPGVRAVHFTGDIFDCGTPADFEASTARFPRGPAPL